MILKEDAPHENRFNLVLVRSRLIDILFTLILSKGRLGSSREAKNGKGQTGQGDREKGRI